jgi:UDP-N-acetylglucosamine enolpyruvyl transferase
MLAWVEAWLRYRPRVEQRPPAPVNTEAVIALDLRASIATVLAGMILSHYQEAEG